MIKSKYELVFLAYETPEKLLKAGKLAFKSNTEQGLPLEVIIDEFKKLGVINTNREAAQVVQEYLGLLTDHSLKSGLEFDGARHNEMIKRNIRLLIKCLETGNVE